MYDQIAHYYDLVHARLEDDVAFLRQLAAGVDGPILELGCGSGRLLLPLVAAGHTGVGVDNSATMLERARRRIAALPAEAQKRVQLVQNDLRDLERAVLPSSVDLVFIGYNTFLHLRETEADSLLRRLRQIAAPEALLYIDIINPFLLSEASGDRALRLEHTLVDPETGQLVQQFSSSWHDDNAQTFYVTWLFDVTPVAGGAVERAVAQHAYHYRYPHELDLQLARAGFQVTNWFGDYDRSPFIEESERLLVLARAQ